MKTHRLKLGRLKSRLMTGVIGAVACFGLMATLAPTADAQRARGNDSQASAPAEGRQFSSAAGEKVNEALQFMNSNQFGPALSKLSEALAIPELNGYERSTIYQMQGSAYYEQNQYGPAISAFENAINAGGLLPNEVSSLRLNIAQLLIANGQNREGATMLENYINQGNPVKPQYVDMLVGAWVQSEDYRRALPWAERWFNEASPKERKHFDLLNFLYNNLGMSGKQADIVLQMINRYPEDNTLWNTWASMLANGGREADAFEVKKMLYLGGALQDEGDVLQIVQYYSFYEMPFQAAKILEREMNAGKISRSTDRLIQLSDLMRQAREYKRAIPILEQAAQSSNTGKVYAQLGEALYNDGQCEKAEQAFRKSIDLGYARGKAWMLIATCRYESSQTEERIDCKWDDEKVANAPRTVARERAIEAFNNVPSSSSEARDARKWRQFIRSEAIAVEKRCEFETNVEKELCFVVIKQAYDATFLNEGNFILPEDQPHCTAYIPEYDSIFRIKVTEDK